MYQIDNPTAATTQPASTPIGIPGFFTDGSPVGGVPATIVPAEWLNAVQQELINAVTASGQTPDKGVFNQLATAMRGRLIAVRTFATAGSFTYTPTPGTVSVEVDVVAAGGAGGSTAATGATTAAAGSGGASGGWARSRITSGFAGVTITVGAGGTSSAAGANQGGNGGSSSFGSLLSATGGTGGNGNAATAPPFVLPGLSPGNGSGGNIINGRGTVAYPAIAQGPNNVVSGYGAPSILGGGGISLGGTGPGSAGITPGSGGSGSLSAANSAAQVGGKGADGIVIVREYA